MQEEFVHEVERVVQFAGTTMAGGRGGSSCTTAGGTVRLGSNVRGGLVGVEAVSSAE